MSTTPAASPAATGPSASHASSRAQPAQGPGRSAPGQPGGDLFSSLLLLLGSTQETTDASLLAGVDSATGDAADDDPGKGLGALPGDNPLAALAAWPGTALTLGQASGKGGAGSGAEAAARLGAGGVPGDAPPALADGARTDEQMQQALIEAARGEPSHATGHSAQGRAGRQAATWRPTVGGAGAMQATSAPGQTTSAHEMPAHQLLQASQSAGVRSTVALGERSGALREADSGSGATEALAPSIAGTGAGAAGGGDAATGGQNGRGGEGQDAAAGWGLESPAETETFAVRDAQDMPAGSAEAGAGQDEAPGGNPWAAAPLRHASLRVGEEGQDSIDIQLNLSGQELRLDFRSDSAEVRASLAESASASLGDMLQRSGIELTDVSVGAQTGGGGQSPSSHQPGTGAPAQTPGRIAREAPDQPAPAVPAARPRSDGSRPLDLFA